MDNVITIISQKGGVGKSTVTTLLANIFFFHFKLRIALIDADFPQVSIGKRRDTELHIVGNNSRLKKAYEQLYKEQNPYPVFKTNLKNCPQKLKELQGQFDYIFVDVTGSINQPGIIEFLCQVNHFFVPVLQDNFSMASALELYGILQKLKPRSKNFRGCKLFFNRVPAKNKIEQLTKSMAGEVEFLDDFLSAYAIYERVYRSTLFPISQKEDRPTQKIFQFADTILQAIESNNAVLRNLEPEKSIVV